MPITEEQREARRRGIGASDAPAILGYNPWKSIADVWAEKVYYLEPDTSSDAAELGNIIEPALVQWAADELGGRMLGENAEFNHDDGIHFCHMDGIAEVDGKWIGIEAKTAGLKGDGSSVEDWDIQNMIPPSSVLIQVAVQMYVASLDVVYVPALLGRGLGNFLFKINRDEDFEESLIKPTIEQTTRFWKDYVLAKKRPSDRPVKLDILRRVRREEGKETIVDTSLFERVAISKAMRDEAERDYKALQSELVETMGDAQRGVCNMGAVTVTPMTRRSLDVKALRRDHEAIAKEYERTTTSAQVRIKTFKQDNNNDTGSSE